MLRQQNLCWLQLGGGRKKLNNIANGLQIAFYSPGQLVTDNRYTRLPSFLEAIRLLLILNPNIHATTQPDCKNIMDRIREISQEKNFQSSLDDKYNIKNISFFHKTYYEEKEKYSDILYCFRQ